MRAATVIASTLLLVACAEEQPESIARIYETAPVETRPIEVTVDAAGVIEPETTVEVKSKASGEILAMYAETGDVVEAGSLLVEIDQRTPRNRLAQAEAELVAARARRTIAETQMERSATLLDTGTLTETEYEQSQLEFANAQAQVIGMEVALENSRIAMDDTEVRAPITGTIIQRNVEPGTVISSPTQDVSGGSILLMMADLTTVQVRTLVDETDIGKIRPGMRTRVTVAAYPNQPFDGEVLKIEPQAIVEQNVTMFAVLIRLENRGGLLKPGMNAEVEIQIANSQAAAVVPTIALRAESDIPTAALMLGIPETELREKIAASAPEGYGRTPVPGAAMGSRERILPEGVDLSQVQAILQKRRSGQDLTAAEQEVLSQAQARVQASGGMAGVVNAGTGNRGVFGGGMGDGLGRFGGGPGPGLGDGGARNGDTAGVRDARQVSVTDYQFGGDYWVVTMRNGEPVPKAVRTGLTDLEYSEIVSGLEPDAEVLLLPSTSLFEQTATLQNFIATRWGNTSPFQAGSR
ncbi:MAG TPA: efflux RND transporter periplasmic adaptor subunit [Gammaproteobacteria bacterium]